MNNIIVRLTVIGITMILLLTSCNSEPSLQKYFVDSQEKDGFVTTTIPKSILGLNVSSMSTTSQKAFNSIEKVNVLYYPIDQQNTAAFEKENAQLKSILNGDDFKTLMSHKSDGMSMKFLYEGDGKTIDEMIVYGSSPEMGLGVARVLGDDMNLGAIMKMMEEMKDVDMDNSMMSGVLGNLGIDMDDEGNFDEDRIKKVMAAKGIDTTDIDFD